MKVIDPAQAAEYGLSGSKQVKTPSQTQSTPDAGMGESIFKAGAGTADFLSNIFVPKAKELARMPLDIAGATGDAIGYTLGINKEKNAKEYSDKAKRVSKTQKKYGFDISKKENQFDPLQYAKGTSKTAAEIAPYMVGAPPSGAGVVKTTLQGIGQGMSTAYSDDEATPQSIAAGGLAGGSIPVMLSAGKAILGKGGKGAKQVVREIFKLSKGDSNELKKFAKIDDWADRAIKNDLPKMAKAKSNEDILKYFTTQLDDAEGALTKHFSKFDKGIDKNKVAEAIGTSYGERADRVLQSEAQSRLKELAKDYLRIHGDDGLVAPGGKTTSFTGSLSLSKARELQKDIQKAAKGAYSTNGSPTPQSESLAGVARKIGELIEDAAPGSSDINRNVMYYRALTDGLQWRLESMPSSLKTITSGALLPGLVGGALSGNPLIGLATGLASGATMSASRSPTIQSKVANAGIKTAEASVPAWLRNMMTTGSAKVGSELGK